MILSPNVAKSGGLHRQGAEGEAVILYCEPLASRVADPVEDGDLNPSGFPGTGKQRSKIDAITGMHHM